MLANKNKYCRVLLLGFLKSFLLKMKILLPNKINVITYLLYPTLFKNKAP